MTAAKTKIKISTIGRAMISQKASIPGRVRRESQLAAHHRHDRPAVVHFDRLPGRTSTPIVARPYCHG
jgi:hypothetical protein